MNQFDQKQMELHIAVLGWLHILSSALSLLIALLLFVLLLGVGVTVGDPEALPILAIVGTVLGLLMAGLAVPGLAAGYGLLRRQAWARILALVLAVFGLPSFPVGTAMAVYTGFVLLQDAAREYFRREA